MSEPLLSESYREEQNNEHYDDIYNTDRVELKPLSNGLLFVVLSLSDWEREKVELLKREDWPYPIIVKRTPKVEEEPFVCSVKYYCQSMLKLLSK